MSKILVLFLLVLIAVSGCIGQTPQVKVATDEGLVSEFASDPTEATEGDTVIFTADIENVGGVTATNIVAELMGVERQWKNPDGTEVTSTLPKSIQNLNPPRPQYNEPGGTKTVQWVLKTPSLPPGIAPEYPVKLKVNFDYKTTGDIRIRGVTRDYQKILIGKGQEIIDPVVDTATNAPVKIIVSEKTRNPMIIDTAEDADDEQMFSYRFLLKNVGSGYPITENIPGRIRGELIILGEGEFADCLEASGKKVTINATNVDLAKLRLPKGEAPIACTIKVKKADWVTKQEDTIHIQFNLDYRYYIENEVVVKIFSK